MGNHEIDETKDLEQFQRQVIQSNVAVYFDYDTAGNIIIERARIPDQAQLLEDLLDFMTTPGSSTSTCKGFELNDDDLQWLEEWDKDWNKKADDNFFCYVCSNFLQCEEVDPSDSLDQDMDKYVRRDQESAASIREHFDSKKIKDAKGSTKKGDKPFRKFIK